jgi:uncharacterized protein
MRRGVVLAALGAAACSFDPSGTAGGGGGGGTIDGGELVADAAGRPDAEVAPAAGHLLLSEVNAVSGGARSSEFIEIFNPTAAPVALDDYYLADDDDYFRLPAAIGSGGTLALDPLNDFVVRFPAGTTIEPGGVLVIGLDRDGFDTAFGRPPDLAIGGGAGTQAMVLVFGSASPSLTDSGEGVVLFRWDGASDLVTDVDMFLAGNMPSAGNLLADKTGQQVDGPDADATPSTYLPDAATIVPTQKRTKVGESYQRIALEGDHELRGGGNGVGGDDETSENTRLTWQSESFGAPTPGIVPASLRL